MQTEAEGRRNVGWEEHAIAPDAQAIGIVRDIGLQLLARHLPEVTPSILFSIVR
jgi:hypothetical protein